MDSPGIWIWIWGCCCGKTGRGPHQRVSVDGEERRRGRIRIELGEWAVPDVGASLPVGIISNAEKSHNSTVDGGLPAGGDPRAGTGPIMPSELQLGAASTRERGQLNAWGRRHKQIFPCLAFPLLFAFAGSHAVTGLSWREHAALRFVALLRHLCLGSLRCRWPPSSPRWPSLARHQGGGQSDLSS